MGDRAISVENLGIRFLIRHMRAPTVHSGLVRFLKGRAKPEEFWALREISFDVDQGEVIGVIGANGSGKSTLLRVLARILSPDEGSVTIRGHVSSLINLSAGFEPTLSGHENIYFNGQLLGLSREEIDAKLEQIVAFADLPAGFIDAPVRTYSSGMRARLGFSVAVHVDPEILVVDEVLTVGDARFRAKAKAKFLELFERGATIVLVQHNLDAIQELCHRVMWLDKGKVQAIGSTEDVIRRYLESQGIDFVPREDPAAKPPASRAR